VHEARKTAGGIIINPAAFTHTSAALLDPLNTFEPPVIEVHIANCTSGRPCSGPG
jgi:3-dehydroquinate dehydratase-2